MRGEILDLFKSTLTTSKAEVQKRFEICGETTECGGQAMRGNTFLIDQLIRIIFDIATNQVYPRANKSTSEKLCIVALGGYGRKELAPS